MLEIKNLNVAIEEKEILKDVNLNFEPGKIYVLMGPNGSGKSTLANIIAGNPKYKLVSGKIFLNGEDITNISPNERAKKGIFLSFQHPSEIQGITLYNFLKTAYNNLHDEKISIIEFRNLLNEKLKLLNLNKDFTKRYLNYCFSGGEKKKSEILQLSVLNPKIIVLDELDSGLDIDSLKTIAQGINRFMNKDKIVLIITHYKRILQYLKPDKIFVIYKGKIVLEGDSKLVNDLEERGYKWIEEVRSIKNNP